MSAMDKVSRWGPLQAVLLTGCSAIDKVRLKDHVDKNDLDRTATLALTTISFCFLGLVWWNTGTGAVRWIVLFSRRTVFAS